MCGRYSFALDRNQMLELVGSAPEPFPDPVFNQSPGVAVPSLCSDRTWESLVWGFDMKLAGGKKKWVINARSETASEKQLFRNGFQKARCILPASGFFEWRRQEAGSQPFYFSARDTDGILLGALRIGNGPETSVIVLTCEADPWMSEVHHRAPVLIRPDRSEAWLEEGRSGEDALETCSFSDQEGSLRRHAVSERVNRVSENDEKLLEPVREEKVPNQPDLFDV